MQNWTNNQTSNMADGLKVQEYTVSEISREINRTMERGFPMVRVKGEVSDLSRSPRGHLYFTLKEDNHALSAIMWDGTANRLGNKLGNILKEGIEISVLGKVTTFSGTSRYQIIVNDLDFAGEGAILAKIEELRNRLTQEGVFSWQNEEELPLFPRTIGVITSPTGSVIRDILHRLNERFPRQVIVWPVAVQGDNCPPEVVRAVEGFNALLPNGEIPRPDLIIVARGGGSFSDLVGFNDENVVRAVALSEIPVISAVGHETDHTLIDLAANKRAPTPTAAAEFAVRVRAELERGIKNLENRISEGTRIAFQNKRQRISDVSKRLPIKENLFQFRDQQLDGLYLRLPRALRSNIQHKATNLSECGARLAVPRVLFESKYKFQALGKGLSSTDLNSRVASDKERLETTGLLMEKYIKAYMKSRKLGIKSLKRIIEGVGYKNTLKRGFAVVRQNNMAITSKEGFQIGKDVEIEWSDGKVKFPS